MVAKHRKSKKVVHIEFESDIEIPGPSNSLMRRNIIRKYNVGMAEKILKEKDAEKGVWDLTADVVQTEGSTGRHIESYRDSFSIAI